MTRWRDWIIGFLIFFSLSTQGWPLQRIPNGEVVQKPLLVNLLLENPYLEPYSIIILLTVIIALVVRMVYMHIRYKVEQAVNLEKIKEEENVKLRRDIGRDFHDEMGNRLARIISFVALARLDKDNIDNTLSKIESAAKDLLKGTKDFIWALDPANDNVGHLFAHVRDFGDWFFADSDITFRAVSRIENNLQLPFGHGRQINMILKESMTNCFKHSKCSRVDLEFENRNDTLVFRVTDNGMGIRVADPEKKEGGIANIIYRANRIDGVLTINSNKERGTSIELILETKKLIL